MKIALIETQYLPSIAYFSALQNVDQIVLEKNEHFLKQSYRNRCYINTAQGKEMLTVPLTSKHGKVLITEVRIDYSQRWQNHQWRTLQSAYNNAPFFEFYAEPLHNILFERFNFLYDLNYSLLSLCLNWLKWSVPIGETLTYEKVPPLATTDLRNVINAKIEEVENNGYHAVPYTQVFGNKFVKNLSLIDLIFCEGPGAASIVQQSIVRD